MQIQATPFSIYTEIQEVPTNDWNKITKGKSIFLSLSYLQSLLHISPTTLELFYVLAYDSNSNPILAGVFQLASFRYTNGTKKKLLFKLFQEGVHTSNQIEIKGLVCGNIFATGVHGYTHSDAITFRAATELMASAANEIKDWKQPDNSFSLLLFKEFDIQASEKALVLEDFKYHSFQADVTMILPIHSSWTSFEVYLQSMKAKYRTKANSAYKKSKRIRLISLSPNEIVSHVKVLEKLYNNVQARSDYHYGDHYPQTFFYLKKELGDQFICKAAMLGEKVVGFSTAFVNGSTFEASYVGIDYAYNSSHALYERLLYGYVEDAIAHKASLLHLGRTSELIKSALGAYPLPMTLYAKHTSKLKNLILRTLLEGISPSPYELRKPFKAKLYDTLNYPH